MIIPSSPNPGHNQTMKATILLISTYELGRQPFGLASPAAWLEEAGFEVRCLDLAVESLDETAVRQADLIAFYLPMHMATRMAATLLPGVRQLNPRAHITCYGLYAAANADYLSRLGADTLIGGEFEQALVALAQRLANGTEAPPTGEQANAVVVLDRQNFLRPQRAGLPPLDRYAQLVTEEGRRLPVGYVEASRGCKHLCRHCPIVPVYKGRFRIVQREVVLADVEQQVALGARHITFGDPDFFNGPGHAVPLVQALHRRFPELTYDVTIKVSHLLQHADLLPLLKETGCLFVTSAVEAFDEEVLAYFDKRHTRQEFETVLELCRAAGLLLVPTFVAFTPWTTLESYHHFLAELVRLDLVGQVAPVQLTIRLLVPPGSHLLALPAFQPHVGDFNEAKFSYRWHNPDPRVDVLQRQIEQRVQIAPGRGLSRHELFQQVWQLAHSHLAEAPPLPQSNVPSPSLLIPHLTEPWYC
jgi:radical SAM superfamily enzyme YgiQ (UPF0313 family)